MNNEEDIKYKQIHFDIPMDLFQEFKIIIPEKGMTSLILRQLVRKYINDVKAGMNPMHIFKHNEIIPEGVDENAT